MAKRTKKDVHPTRIRKTIKEGKLEVEKTKVESEEVEEVEAKEATKSEAKESSKKNDTIELEDDTDNEDGVGDEDEDSSDGEDSEDEGDEEDESEEDDDFEDGDEDDDASDDPEEVEEGDDPGAVGDDQADVAVGTISQVAAVVPNQGAPVAVPPPEAPTPSVAQEQLPDGPLMIEQLSASSLEAVSQIVLDIHNALVAEGKDIDTTRKYGVYAKKFFATMIQQGMKLESIPPDALRTYAQRWANLATQNVYMNSINSFIKKANEIGITITPQVFTLNKLAPKGSRYNPMPQDPNTLPSGVPIMANTFDPMSQQPQQVHHRAPRAQAAPQMVRPATVDGLPVGGKVVIYKQALGNEMPGIAPGQLIHVGTYPPSVVANDGDINSFVQRWVVPRYGPFAGGNDMTYVVQRLDDRGNKTRMDEAISIAAPIGPGEFGGNPRPAAPAPVAPTSPNDKVVDMLNRQIDLLSSRYESVQAKLMDGKGGSGDPMAAFALMEAKREADDLRRQIEDVKKERIELEQRRREMPPPPATPMPHGGGLGGLFDLAPVQSTGMDKMVEVMGNLMTALVAIKNQPPPAPAPVAAAPARDPMMEKMFELLLAKMMKPDTDPVVQSLMQELREMKARMEKPDKSKDFAETLGNIKEAMGLVNMLNGGGERPSTIVELAEVLAPHMDKIGTAFGNILGAFAGKAPQLPAHQPAPVQAQQQAPNAPAKRPQLPDGIKAALNKMVTAPADSDQQVVDGLFEIVKIFQSNPEWVQVAQVVGNRFMNAESKPELRSLVTNMMLICGDKKLASNESAIERVTMALHRNYSFLFSTISGGQQKRLIDAEPETPVEELPDDPEEGEEDSDEPAAEVVASTPTNGATKNETPAKEPITPEVVKSEVATNEQ